jgi:hypothetical protein
MKHAPGEATTTELVPLLMLGQCKCKWRARYDARVIGNYLFCGRETDSKTYCDRHQALTCAVRRY